MKIFFNCLVYKDQDVVGDFILNIKKFVEDPVIVLHISPDFEDFDFTRFGSINNVFINPIRYPHGQWNTKVKALISNHDFLKSKNINFDYEIIFYPKMLFIKKGIEDYIDGVDICMPTPNNEKREKMEFALNTKMDVFTEHEKEMFNNDIEKFLVEGLVFSSSVAENSYEFIKCSGLYNREGHCFEEFILPTVGKFFSSNIKDYPGIISYWDLPLDQLKMIVNQEVSEFTSFFTDNQKVENIYLVHKVDYGYENDARKFIRGIR